MRCPYCETDNGYVQECEFCGADLNAKRPTVNSNLVIDVDAYKPQPVLATFHTYDLLLLLQYVRKERTEAYKLMQSVKRAPEEANINLGTITFGEDEYKRHTAQMKVIEGVLIDRLGYKPKRVDDKLLNTLEVKIKKA
ncbi:hypothetical protein NC661_21230 [Aquibacillus koreensis]|uniref:Uncharacterized protein n=1 Tax=Aquibacillus koreensis TaxID=279446 RepID=A0A9X3WNE6_9BACI|nr:hypothetical protein [Aquibacillus koreensis]MDC3422870.1 hypothetical protein [Aquibacillus koreensis]